MQVHFQSPTFEHDKLTCKGNLECIESIEDIFAEQTQPNYVKLFSCIYMMNSSASGKVVTPEMDKLNVDKPQADPK